MLYKEDYFYTPSYIHSDWLEQFIEECKADPCKYCIGECEDCKEGRQENEEV